MQTSYPSWARRRAIAFPLSEQSVCFESFLYIVWYVHAPARTSDNDSATAVLFLASHDQCSLTMCVNGSLNIASDEGNVYPNPVSMM